MLLMCARHVDLLGRARKILDLNGEQPARRAREEHMQRHYDIFAECVVLVGGSGMTG